jgi:hypothetical protein
VEQLPLVLAEPSPTVRLLVLGLVVVWWLMSLQGSLVVGKVVLLLTEVVTGEPSSVILQAVLVLTLLLVSVLDNLAQIVVLCLLASLAALLFLVVLVLLVAVPLLLPKLRVVVFVLVLLAKVTWLQQPLLVSRVQLLPLIPSGEPLFAGT